MGNDQEFVEMTAYINENQLIPIVDSVKPFEEILEVFDRMKDTEQFGKLVVTFE
jgi:NADPH:quinone reductase-like Zn-dependent oxidoreductase